MHHHGVGETNDAGYGNDVADEIQFVVDGAVDRIRSGHQKNRIAVSGGGMYYSLGCNVAVSPRSVFNDERLA